MVLRVTGIQMHLYMRVAAAKATKARHVSTSKGRL